VTINLRQLGTVDYTSTLAAMQEFTFTRFINADLEESNQIWICEHIPVFTQGIAGKKEHIFNPGLIPVVQTDRGGQVTYHGPGQVVAYPLINLKHAGYFVKEYVFRLEEAVLKTLLHFGITGYRVGGAPGIYVQLDDPFGHSSVVRRSPHFDGLGKIAALGIKVSRHCTYHGLALNVSMDLEPFSRINPCGYTSLQTIDMASLGVNVSMQEVASVLAIKLQTFLIP
jgi:lipoyl(octanoyl) transferase